MARRKRPMTERERDWIFGGKPRSKDRVAEIQERVSEAIKSYGPRTYHRYDPALRFARRMRAKAARLRGDGFRDLVDAMCWGVGSGHRREMIKRYEAAAIAAERFCRRR